ncbi:MAG: transglycosylase SLT domain-containing protein, partial [Myxococcota bacterium]|nr:transglycosylase SLT domain-containing protein [Myxococcota bacterium]
DAIRSRAMEAALRAANLDAALGDAEALAASGGRYAARAAFVAGEIALARERWQDARRIFAALDAERTYSTGRIPRSLDVADVLFGLARALEGAGEAVEARRAFERLVRWYPESPRAAEAEARLRAADPSFEISPRWRLDRAREMVKHRDWAEAIDELDRVPADAPGISREEVAFERAMALYKHRRRYAEAARAFQAVVAMRGPHEEDAAFHRARSLARSHRDDDAIAAYREFARRYPRGRRASEASYLAASLELYLGRFDAAIASLEALVGRNRAGPGLDDARWSLALAYMLAGRPADALPLIDGAEDDDRGALVRGRALYWGAVARIALGRETEAVERLETAIRDYPLHYYALLARNRLEALGRTPPPPLGRRDAGRADSTGGCDDLPPEIAALREAGLVDEARALLVDALRAGMAAAEGDDLRATTRRLLCVDGVQSVYRHAVGAHQAEIAAPLSGATLPFWEAAYPRAYRGRVEAACESEGIPPHMIWAIMRHESAFEPATVSYADAIGLLQMIPPTTRRIVEARGGTYDDSLLFDPASNIDLGVGYIARIGRKFHDQVALLAAGYNGGPHNVARWLGAFREERLDLFVERIPFEQTRTYVRRVVGSYARYLYLYESDADEWPLRLPDAVRSDFLQDPDF